MKIHRRIRKKAVSWAKSCCRYRNETRIKSELCWANGEWGYCFETKSKCWMLFKESRAKARTKKYKKMKSNEKGRGNNDRKAERSFSEILDGRKPKSWWKISSGIGNKTKKQTEIKWTHECTPKKESSKKARLKKGGFKGEILFNVRKIFY